MERRRVVALCVTGSIAAYKAVELARCLVKAGAQVLPVMTASATRFVGPVTLAGVCGEAVATDMWDASFAGEMHVRIADRAELIVIAPATADVLARLAQGRADDLVTALALCARAPILAAPAMHPRMWDHPATRRNIAELAAQGRVTLVGPVNGEVASGDVGLGRMAEPGDIADAASARMSTASSGQGHPLDLAGTRVVVTAGPTVEDIDPVRYLGNRSSGRMGFAIAASAAARGAVVTLIAGPVSLPTPARVRRIDVRGAAGDARRALGRARQRSLRRRRTGDVGRGRGLPPGAGGGDEDQEGRPADRARAGEEPRSAGGGGRGSRRQRRRAPPGPARPRRLCSGDRGRRGARRLRAREARAKAGRPRGRQRGGRLVRS